MLNEIELRKLILEGVETSNIDYKAEPYRFDTEDLKSKFIKDIISMANTPRQTTSYIILGVKLHPDGRRDLLGITSHLDDADLQDKLNLVKPESKPIFLYQPVSVDGLSFGLIEIPIVKTGPYRPTRDYGVIKAQRTYFRRGTQNDEASSVEDHKRINQWFWNSEDRISSEKPYELSLIPNWDEFSVACHNFPLGRIYLYVVGPTDISQNLQWKSLAKLPLSLVLDFDPQTQSDGAFAQIEPTLRTYRSLHLWTLGNKPESLSPKACYWFAAQGLENNAASLVNGSWQQWNRKYGESIQELLKEFAKSSGGRPLTVICLWHAPEYLRQICAMVDRVFGDSADYVFAGPNADRLSDLSSQFNSQCVKIALESVLFGINQNIQTEGTDNSLIIGIPKADRTFTSISPQILHWLAEDMTILHSNIEFEVEFASKDSNSYLRGRTISWQDLDYHIDAERDKTAEIQQLVQKELDNRSNIRINLYHWPGSGGTTVARRIGWALRRQYPVLLLHNINQGETTNRFREIFRLTGQSIFAIAEGADVAQDMLQQLYNELKADNIPVTFLNVVRRFQLPPHGERSIFISQHLSNSESFRFAEVYKRVATTRTSTLNELIKRTPEERTAFQFALTAFGKDYIGLTRYVEARLEAATEIQRQLLVYIALAYYYGHKPILAQFFAVFLGRPENQQLRLDNNNLAQPQLELLIQEKDGYWRPIHQIVAEEILTIVLAGAGDRRNWKRSLTLWAVEFINVCGNSALLPSHDVLDLVRRVFVLRNETEILGTEGAGSPDFAALIKDIQTDEGRLTVFKQLVESFPNEAHFWGHLGRFYSVTMREPELAIAALDRAISIESNDPVIHHMKGMCYRNIAYRNIDYAKQNATLEEGKLTIEQPLNLALEAFEEARKLDIDSEHAYISPIQMLLRALDFGFTTSRQDSRSRFLTQTSPTTKWYRELLDHAEYLMDEVRRIREGENPSSYILGCQAILDQIYDDYEQALQGWQNLLSRSDVYAPPVRRQIIRAYLARKDRKWDDLTEREVTRIIELLEDNLREEPASEHNMRLWFRSIRYSPLSSIDFAIDNVANWRAIGDSPDSYYFLYILHVLKAMDGSTIESQRSNDLIEQSRNRSRNIKNRNRSHDWLGKGNGLQKLINSTELGDWDRVTDFYKDIAKLARVSGRIADITAPEAGTLELSSTGLKVFFVPAKANILKGRDENKLVTFYLGFSYQGLRAWSVQLS